MKSIEASTGSSSTTPTLVLIYDDIDVFDEF